MIKRSIGFFSIPGNVESFNENFHYRWLLRATGAFFIRRRIDGDGRPPNLDLLYRSVLEAYMIEILRARMPLEFFLEGTRFVIYCGRNE